jgi:hypothetical protein
MNATKAMRTKPSRFTSWKFLMRRVFNGPIKAGKLGQFQRQNLFSSSKNLALRFEHDRTGTHFPAFINQMMLDR